MQVGRGVIGQAKEFKALQALTEQLNAAQQRVEVSGKTEAAAARAAIQALAESVNKRLGVGEFAGKASLQQGLSVPYSTEADAAGCIFGGLVSRVGRGSEGITRWSDQKDPSQLGEFKRAGQACCDELDTSMLLAACTAWLPSAACTDEEEPCQHVIRQQAKHLPVESFSAWLPAAEASSTFEAADGDRHVDDIDFVASASSWLPPTLFDVPGPATQDELSRISNWLPPQPASASAAIMRAGEGFSCWLPPAASSAAAATGYDRQMDVASLLASASFWLPPSPNEMAQHMEVRRLVDEPVRDIYADYGLATQVEHSRVSAWLPHEPASAAIATAEAGWDATSVLGCISAWMPQTDVLPMHQAAITHTPSRRERMDGCTPDDRLHAPCLNFKQPNLANICSWLPASDTSAAGVDAKFNGVDSDLASMLSSLTAWFPQPAPASSSAPKSTNRLAIPSVFPKLPAPPLRLTIEPLLPGQCEVEVDSWTCSELQPKQSLPVRSAPRLTSNAALASEMHSVSGGRTRDVKVSSHGIGSAGGSGGKGEGVPSAGRTAMGSGMQLEPLPRLTAARKTRG